ncbi:unnamed protein product [Sphagnum jensenii]|uniref:Uncharacterized protein n=1 Tax=Sphagnum jensenii TaxID=128206 RepID=A0ABP1A348_9BRYO
MEQGYPVHGMVSAIESGLVGTEAIRDLVNVNKLLMEKGYPVSAITALAIMGADPTVLDSEHDRKAVLKALMELPHRWKSMQTTVGNDPLAVWDSYWNSVRAPLNVDLRNNLYLRHLWMQWMDTGANGAGRFPLEKEWVDSILPAEKKDRWKGSSLFSSLETLGAALGILSPDQIQRAHRNSDMHQKPAPTGPVQFVSEVDGHAWTTQQWSQFMRHRQTKDERQRAFTHSGGTMIDSYGANIGEFQGKPLDTNRMTYDFIGKMGPFDNDNGYYSGPGTWEMHNFRGEVPVNYMVANGESANGGSNQRWNEYQFSRNETGREMTNFPLYGNDYGSLVPYPRLDSQLTNIPCREQRYNSMADVGFADEGAAFQSPGAPAPQLFYQGY